MNSSAELLIEIRKVLGTAISPSLSTFSNTSDIFEAYVFCLIIQAARVEGATIYYRDVHGNTPTTFVFRTSPGYIYSTVHTYTHAVIEFPNKPPLENHIGVRVVGKSGVLHECDVAVIEQAEAETCRRSTVPPRSHKVLIAVECKFYTTLLHLNLARAFIGLTTDISNGNRFFVSNTQSESVERLLSNRKRDWEHNLTPRATIEVDRLRHKFQDAFHHFKAA